MKKKLMAVMMAAVMAVTSFAFPASEANAATTCTNAAGHQYKSYCLGYEKHIPNTHVYTELSIVLGIIPTFHKKECTYMTVWHGQTQSCTYCGSFGGNNGSHINNYNHQDCAKGIVYTGACSGMNSEVVNVY